MRLQHLPVASLLLIFLAASSYGQLPPTPREPVSVEQLPVVLVKARDAIVDFALHDPATENTEISEIVRQLKDDFLLIGDRQNVRYLQQHLRETYADQIRHALAPSNTLGDFAQRLAEAQNDSEEFRRDDTVREIVTEQISRGFLEDALTSAKRIDSSFLLLDTLAQVAASAQAQGKTQLARLSIDAGVQAALNPKSYPLLVPPSYKLLLRFATELQDASYQRGARLVLMRASQALASNSSSDFQWEELAGVALHLHDLSAAAEAQTHVNDEQLKLRITDHINAVHSRDLNPAQAVDLAKTLKEPSERVSALCDLARRQAAAGDKNGSARSIQLAVRQIPDGEQFAVLLLNDIAWTQIDIGDRRGAEETVRLAVAKNGAEEDSVGQITGWATLANTLAALGHFSEAHAIVDKIEDPSFRGWAFNHIVYAQVFVGHMQEAMEFADQLTDAEERSQTFMGIAKALLKQ